MLILLLISTVTVVTVGRTVAVMAGIPVITAGIGVREG